MRIAIFTNNYLPRVSGVAVAVDFLDRALKRNGHETFVIAPDYGCDSEVPGVHLHRVKSFSIPNLKFAVAIPNMDRERIFGIIEGFRPHVIHSHHPFLLGDAAVLAANEFGIPLVYTFHTLYTFFTHYFKADFPEVRERVRRFVSQYAKACDLIVTPTEPIRQYLLGMDVKNRIEVVPTGIDATRFQNITEDRVTKLRRQYGLMRFDSVLLNVGRITKEKNIDLCLATLQELVQRDRNCCLLFFGTGPDAGRLQDDAMHAGVGDRVIMGGFLDQETLAAAYRLGSVFLFPSLSDTQGIVLYEACASGLPIVATRSMASSAVIDSGVNGLFAENNPRDFADKAECILNQPDRYVAPLDLEEYSHSTLGKKYTQIYGEVAKTGRRRKNLTLPKFADLFSEIRKL
jgi:glycosyltransferase involved in cell wall biosynthesis